jgi:hypothetical protein
MRLTLFRTPSARFFVQIMPYPTWAPPLQNIMDLAVFTGPGSDFGGIELM